MADASNAVLSYGRSATSLKIWLSHFEPLWAILPLSGGMLLGLLNVVAVCFSQPVLQLPGGGFHLWPLLAFPGVCIAWVVETAILFLICCLSTGPLLPRRWPIASALGFALPLLLTWAVVLVHVVRIGIGSTESVEATGLQAVAVGAAAIALVTPFFLVRRQHTDTPLRQPRARLRRFTAAATIMLAIEISLVGTWRWLERRTLDRGCAKLAAWVATAYPVPALHPNLAMPAPLQTLSIDGHVDATVMPDRRVILLLKTNLSFHQNWYGIIYATAPIQPGETRLGSSGPEPMIPGLSEYCVSKKVDDCHFAVGFDLN